MARGPAPTTSTCATRRLLPALIPTLGLLALYLVFFGTPEIVDKWAAGIASSLTYMMNWLEIWQGNSYWDAQTAESPVRHLWSFAVEEQFYLFAPIFLILCLRKFGSSARVAIAGFCVVGTVASVAWMSHLHHPGQDPTRAYYGTDTRAHTILVGILLALAVHSWGPIRTAAGRLVANIVGSICLVVFVVMLFRVNGQSSWMFEYGGFLLVALLTSAIIFSCSQPTSWMHPIFASSPAMAAGIISYGIYLYHQPVNKLLTEDRAHFGGWPLDIVRFGLTLGIAYVSFHFFEKRMGKAKALNGARGLAWAMGGTAAVLGILLFAVLNVPNETVAQTVVLNPDASVTEPPTGFDGIAGVDRPVRVLVVGDSVMDQLGTGLTRYAIDHPDQLVVLNKAHIGCGITDATDQRYTDADGTVLQGTTNPLCRTWSDEIDPKDLGDPAKLGWPTAVKWFRPDAVIMYPSPWDATDRKLPQTGSDWVFPSVKAYDDILKADYSEGIKTLTSAGARLYYMPSPYLGDGRASLTQSAKPRFDLMNEMFTQAVSESGVAATRIDYPAWLGPVDGERDRRLRRDGVHLSEVGIEEFAEVVATDHLLVGR